MAYSYTEKKRIRKSFAKRAAVLDAPFLLATQIESFAEFLQADTPPEARRNQGLQAAFTSIFPISSHSGNARLEYVQYMLLGGLAIPGNGFLVVLGNASAVGVQEPKSHLPACISLFGGLAVPGRGLFVVLGYALAVFVQAPEVVLRDCLPALRQRQNNRVRSCEIATVVCSRCVIKVARVRDGSECEKNRDYCCLKGSAAKAEMHFLHCMA